MELDEIEIVFETNIPVGGQIIILESIDYLYSAFALRDLGWSSNLENTPEWFSGIVNLPGKFVADENLLRAKSAKSGSIIETISGIATVLSLLLQALSFYMEFRRRHKNNKPEEEIQSSFQSEYMLLVMQPLIAKLRNKGVSEQELAILLNNCYNRLEVLNNLVESNKLKINDYHRGKELIT